MLFGSRFGRVLGRVFGAFWTILGGFWGFQNESNFEPEVGRRKSDLRDARGRWKSGLSALITIVDQPIVGIVDRRSLKSLIVGSLIVDIVDRWTLTSSNSLRSVTNHAHFVPRKLGHGGGYILYMYIYLFIIINIIYGSTIVIRAARTSGRLPLTSLKSLFRLPTSASKLDVFS